jgi:iron complex outermembrane receptor protein
MMTVDAGKTVLRVAASLAVWVTVLLSGTFAEAGPGQAVVTGTVLDPSGHCIPGATLTLVDSLTGISKTVVSSNSGLYDFPDLPAGAYHLKAGYPGFAPYSQDVTLGDHELRNLDVTLQLPARRESVTVTTPWPGVYTPLAGTQRQVDDSDQARSLDTAELLSNLPEVSLRDNGDLATIPLLHGLGDERARVMVNGMTVSASCPNHMNPPLSYIDPSQVAQVNVMAGITPVSMGGDSIGGTIAIESPPPVFARPGERVHTEGAFSTFFRSNGQSYGASLAGSVATQNFSFGYSGSWTNTDDYLDGSGHLVTSTYAQNANNSVTLAAQGAGNLLILQAGFQNTPYQGFPNQQMDMVGNHSEFLNFHYRRDVGWGVLDTRVFWQNVRHEMNIGKDKSTFPMAMWMPMDTHGRDLGYSAKLGIPLSERHTVQLGSEFQRFGLEDIWPAVPGAAPYMGPNPFVNINDGHRSRLAWFGEVASKWNSRWTTLLGIRNDTVWTNTGPVSGYSDAAMYAMDADTFNSLNRARTDINIDLTASARYELNRHSTFEIGYARKTRAPNLYERYAWSTDWMSSGMINWFGDGNYYVGNVNLKPEVAHTVSGAASWHDRARKEWEIKATPYLTYIRDYIDVDELATQTYGESTFSQLQFANHNARIYGADVAGDVAIWKSARYGRGEITGVAGWLHGTRLDTGTGLYQMMPLNTRLGFTEKLKRWSAGPEVQLVDRKFDVDPRRFEQRTPGDALLNFNAGYQWRHLRIDAGAHNLLNKCYFLPLGGVNFDDFQASGWMSQIRPLTGPGRSFYMGLSVPF